MNRSYRACNKSANNFQFIDSDFDRLPGFDFGLFAGLDFTSVGIDRVSPHAFQLIRVVVASSQDRVFAADLLIAFEFQIYKKIFRAAADFDSVLVRCEKRFSFVLAVIADGEEWGERRASSDDGSIGVFSDLLRRFGLRSR